MWDGAAEARRWWLQADNDLGFARLALREAYYHQACFIAQQAAEKAVKSIGYHLGDRTILGHSVTVLVDRYAGKAPELADLRGSASVLDLYYVPLPLPQRTAGRGALQVLHRAAGARGGGERGSLRPASERAARRRRSRRPVAVGLGAGARAPLDGYRPRRDLGWRSGRPRFRRSSSGKGPFPPTRFRSGTGRTSPGCT